MQPTGKNPRNWFVGALFLAGFLSAANAAERLRGVRRTMRDGEHKSTKHGYAPEGPTPTADRTGQSDQAKPTVLPSQTGNQNGKYKANIFQKSHGGPPVYQETEQDLSENSEVDEVSNDLENLGLFENSSKSLKRHKPNISSGMKKLGHSTRHDNFHSSFPVSSPLPLPDMATPPYHVGHSENKSQSSSQDGLKSKSLKHKQYAKSKKNKAYIHKYNKLPSSQYDMPVVYYKKSKSKDGMKSDRRKYSYRLPHYMKPSFPSSPPFPSVSPNVPSLATAQPPSSMSPTFPNDTMTVAPTTMATPSVATTSPSMVNASGPTMIPTTSRKTPTNANTIAPTALPLPQTASPTQESVPVLTVSPAGTVSPTTPVDPPFPTATTAPPTALASTPSLESSTIEPTPTVTDPSVVEPTPIIPTDLPIAGLTPIPTLPPSEVAIDPPSSIATTPPTTLASTPSPDSSTIQPTPTVTDPSVVEPTPMIPTDSPIAGITQVPTLPPSEVTIDPPSSIATTPPTLAPTTSLDSSTIQPTATVTDPSVVEPTPIIPTDSPIAGLTPMPTPLSTTRDPTLSPTVPEIPTLPPTVLGTIVATASPTVPNTTEPTITPPSLATVPPDDPDDSPTNPGSPVLPSVEIPDDLAPCEDDPKCIVLQSAIFDVFPLEKRANIGIPGTCQNWAREWMRSDPIFNAGLAIDRTRQRYALAEMYCELQGDDWTDRQQFLAPIDECDWFTAITEDICDSDGIIEILRLPENNMVGTMPPELSMMSSLQEITFENNSIQGSVPEDYTTMSNLRSLDLSSNVLDGPIPEFVWDLTPLEVLDLSNNGFTGFIPAIIRTENLQILSLSNNDMTGAIPALFGLLNWNILQLDNNQFSGEIPPDLSSPDIQELLLHNNRLTGNFPADNFVNSEDFAELLTTVMIHGNTITGDVNSMCVLFENGALETFVVDLGEVVCDCCQPAP